MKFQENGGTNHKCPENSFDRASARTCTLCRGSLSAVCVCLRACTCEGVWMCCARTCLGVFANTFSWVCYTGVCAFSEHYPPSLVKGDCKHQQKQKKTSTSQPKHWAITSPKSSSPHTDPGSPKCTATLEATFGGAPCLSTNKASHHDEPACNIFSSIGLFDIVGRGRVLPPISTSAHGRGSVAAREKKKRKRQGWNMYKSLLFRVAALCIVNKNVR